MGNYPCKTEVTLAIADTGAEHLYKYNGLYNLNATKSSGGWPNKIGDIQVETLQWSPFGPVMPTPAWWESEDGNAIWMGDDFKWRVGSLADKGTGEGDIIENTDSETGTTCPHEYVAEGSVYPCEMKKECDDNGDCDLNYVCDGNTYGPSEWKYKASAYQWVESDAIYTRTGEVNLIIMWYNTMT